jgi:hypothetical protein
MKTIGAGAAGFPSVAMVDHSTRGEADGAYREVCAR